MDMLTGFESADSVSKEILRQSFGKSTYKGIIQKKLLLQIFKDIKFQRPSFLPFKNGKYTFDVAMSQKELIEAFRLRFLAYSDPSVNYIDARLFPLGLEFDKYDGASTHFYARDKSGKMCSYIRLICDSCLGLQVDIGLDISDYREKYKIAEMSRLITYPRGQPKARKIVFDNLIRHAISLGTEKLVGEARLAQKEYYDRIGIEPMTLVSGQLRTWKLKAKKSWGSARDELIYGNVINLDMGVSHLRG